MEKGGQKIREHFRSMSIQRKMAYAFSMVFIFLSIIQILVYSWYITQVVSSDANNYILQTIKQGSGKIDSYTDSLKIIANNIISDTAIRNIVVQHSEALQHDSKPLTYMEEKTIDEELSKLTLAYDFIHSIQIYTTGFTVNYNFVSEFGGYSDIFSTKDGKRLQQSNGELVLFSPHQEYIDKISGKKEFVFTAARKIIDYQTGLEFGYVFINVSEEAIRDIISDITPVGSGEVLVFDSEGSIVSSLQKDDIGKQLEPDYLTEINRLGAEGYFFSTENHTRYIIVYHRSSQNQWSTMTRIPVSDAAGDLNKVHFINLIISLTGILIAITVSWAIARGLTRPLKRLVHSMEQVGSGNLSVQVEVQSQDEIGHLGMVFNRMIDELQSLIDQYYHEQLSAKEAQLKAIRAQINPHFLYNTLDTIYWMLVLKGEQEVSDLVVSLSEILRYSISRGDDQDSVSAKTDLGILEHYFNLQKARFGDRLEWSMEIDPQIYRCLIPKMMVQPVVENAINHGMRPIGSPLHIRLAGAIHDGQVQFTVEDDGVGMSKDQMDGIFREKLNDVQNRSTGFGLVGVNQRIKILFGESYGLRMESEVGRGTTVTITVPRRDMPGGG